MKKVSIILISTLFLFFSASSQSMAIPTLELDISDGFYVGAGEESIVTTSTEFTLFAILNLNGDDDRQGFGLADKYYISVALSNLDGKLKETDGGDLGSFDFAGSTVQATDDMTFGAPPIEAEKKSDDIPGHGIYSTYYYEYEFTFNTNNTTSCYNSQDNPGGLDAGGTGCYYVGFDVNWSNILVDNSLHFDLYTKNVDGSLGVFAPFSHDAATAEAVSAVPEPSTVLLLGMGLVAIGLVRRKTN